MRARLIFLAIFVAGCSSAKSEAPAPRPADPAPAAPPAYVMPDMLGPTTLEDENPDPNIVEVSLTAAPASASFLDGKTTTVLAYNGSLPGPLLRAKVGDEVVVHFKNALAEATTIHWHGLRIPDDMDGSPRVQSPVKPGADFTYRFKVPDAGSFWYHPHVHADAQVEKGLYGAIVVFDPKDPAYDAERYLVLDDIRVTKDGAVAPQSSMDGMMGGRFGNVLLTNGRPVEKAHEATEQGKIERWRLVNTANARTMELGLRGASFRVIATDGGLLPEPFTPERLVLPVGQRYDLEVTYDRPGKVELVNYVETYDSNNKPKIVEIPSFTVDVSENARTPRAIEWPSVTLPDREADTAALLTLGLVNDATGAGWTLNGKLDPMEPLFTWREGATVDLTIVNKVEREHPFHLHGQFFRVLSPPMAGLKDVVLVGPKKTVKIRAYLDNPGRWMAHCHILEHAELGMMGEIVVTPTNGAVPASGGGHKM